MQIKQLAANQTEVGTSKARILISYSTPVAAYVYEKGYIRTSIHYSRTTSKHINKWIGGSACEEVDQSILDELLSKWKDSRDTRKRLGKTKKRFTK